MRVPDDVHAEIKRLATLAARHGWQAFGIDRDDGATNTAIIEEAVKALAARFDSKIRSRR